MRIKLAPLTDTARGRSGGIVFTKGRGATTLRRFKHPVNTQSVARTNARVAFANLQTIYSAMPGWVPWCFEDYPLRGARTPRNLWLSLNLKTMIGEPDLSKLVATPALYPGLMGPGTTAEWAAYYWLVYPDYPDTPPGWTYYGVVAWAIRSYDFTVRRTGAWYWLHTKSSTAQPAYLGVAINEACRPYLGLCQLVWLDPAGRRIWSAAWTKLETE